MKYLVLMAMILTGLARLSAQSNDPVFEFEFENPEVEISETSSIGSHFFGDEAAVRVYKLIKLYTYQQPVSSIDPSLTTIVEKPAIYAAVKKLERYYKKAAKKGHLEKEYAATQFLQVLDVALSIRHQYTEEFERFLETLDSEESIQSAFLEKTVLR